MKRSLILTRFFKGWVNYFKLADMKNLLKQVHEVGNCRKGGWRVAFMLNNVLTNKEIARQGYISLTSYYAQVCEK